MFNKGHSFQKEILLENSGRIRLEEVGTQYCFKLHGNPLTPNCGGSEAPQMRLALHGKS